MSEKIIKIAALVIIDKKLLLVRSHNQDAFFTLGGKLEDNESELDCLKREVKEEVGCEISSAKYFKFFEGTAHNRKKLVQLFCYLVELEGNPVPLSEIAELHWWDSSSKINLSDMLKLQVIPALKDFLNC